MVKSLMHWLRPTAWAKDRRLSQPPPANSADGGNDRVRLLKIKDVHEEGGVTYNPFILTGYRRRLGFFGCLKSLFLLHNETVNIWTHLIGFIFFAGLFVHDLVLAIPTTTEDGTVMTNTDFLILSTLMICYQATMILSSIYHTFECHSSSEISDACMSLDIVGITLSLMASYLSGIYYSFWCEPSWRDFYLCAVGGIFLVTISLHLAPSKYMSDDKYQSWRVLLFSVWTIFGLVPTFHWVYLQGVCGVIRVMLPRIFVLYAILGTAMFFYVTKMPERLVPGMVDLIGHSHQWWHVFVFLALLFWHRTGLQFAVFRLKHGCIDDKLIREQDLDELALNLWPFSS